MALALAMVITNGNGNGNGYDRIPPKQNPYDQLYQGEHEQSYQETATVGGNVEYYQLPGHLYGAAAYLHG